VVTQKDASVAVCQGFLCRPADTPMYRLKSRLGARKPGSWKLYRPWLHPAFTPWFTPRPPKSPSRTHQPEFKPSLLASVWLRSS